MGKLCFVAVLIAYLNCSQVYADSGKEEIGKVEVSLYLGSNSAKIDTRINMLSAPESVKKSLKKNSKTQFNHYFKLGNDSAAILRSYENWATPLKPAETIMLSFEPVGKPVDDSIQLDLELWQNKKKIMKSAATSMRLGKPLFIRGPQWLGGFLIIGVELKHLN